MYQDITICKYSRCSRNSEAPCPALSRRDTQDESPAFPHQRKQRQLSPSLFISSYCFPLISVCGKLDVSWGEAVRPGSLQVWPPFCSSSSTAELARNATSLRPTERPTRLNPDPLSRTLRLGPAICVLTSPSEDSDVTLRTTHVDVSQKD